MATLRMSLAREVMSKGVIGAAEYVQDNVEFDLPDKYAHKVFNEVIKRLMIADRQRKSRKRSSKLVRRIGY